MLNKNMSFICPVIKNNMWRNSFFYKQDFSVYMKLYELVKVKWIHYDLYPPPDRYRVIYVGLSNVHPTSTINLKYLALWVKILPTIYGDVG